MKVFVIMLHTTAFVQASMLARREDDLLDYVVDSQKFDSLSSTQNNEHAVSVITLDPNFDYECNTCKSFAQRAQESLEVFVPYLRIFNSEKSFDINHFEFQRDRLSNELKQIKLAVEKTPSPELHKQFDFVDRVFHDLEEYVTSLKHYKTKEEAYNRWMYKAVIVNVQLLLMHDSYGNLDRSLHQTVPRLQRFWRSLNLWKEMVRSSAGVPTISRILFDERILEAEQTIEKFMSQALQNEGNRVQQS